MAEFVMPIMVRPYEVAATFTWEPTERDRARAIKNHNQTLERLKERGGVDWDELDAILRDVSWMAIRQNEAEQRCRAELERRLAKRNADD